MFCQIRQAKKKLKQENSHDMPRSNNQYNLQQEEKSR